MKSIQGWGICFKASLSGCSPSHAIAVTQHSSQIGMPLRERSTLILVAVGFERGSDFNVLFALNCQKSMDPHRGAANADENSKLPLFLPTLKSCCFIVDYVYTHKLQKDIPPLQTIVVKFPVSLNHDDQKGTLLCLMRQKTLPKPFCLVVIVSLVVGLPGFARHPADYGERFSIVEVFVGTWKECREVNDYDVKFALPPWAPGHAQWTELRWMCGGSDSSVLLSYTWN